MKQHVENNFIEHLARALKRGRAVLVDTAMQPAAVLVPLVLRNGEPYLILTRRAMTLARHKGQISFPGGAAEPGDRDAVNTALRESEEEIGLRPDRVHIVGQLDDFITISGFLVTPVVGIVPSDQTFEIDTREVAELFEVPLWAFRDPAAHELIAVNHDGQPHEYHSYKVNGYVIWGATAGVIHDLLLLLKGNNEIRHEE